MKPQEVNEVLACLGKERRVFRYFKDRYCFDLMDLEMKRRGVSALRVADLKQTNVGRFLNKPAVASALGKCGSGVVRREDLPLLWPWEQMAFTLSFDRWGDGDRGWDQTTRNQSNLVLQINFDGGHRACYQRLIKPNMDYGPFESWCHPVAQGESKTLAWVRLDIDFDTDEVLIEEIQNDWLRKATRVLEWVRRRKRAKPDLVPGELYDEIEGSYEDLEHYVEEVLQPYQVLWAEAAMLAAIRFVSDELGMSTLYYHSYVTGQKLKRVVGSPPRSLYTKLPKDFGFQLTREVPAMLARSRCTRRYLKAIPNPSWYRMDL
ncbi:MAG: hypothetical protein D9N11_04205 [Ketobacter sp.]|nr:MAG: hypothetical protein D9N11_04205 [Ketobacter sp.]